MSKSSDCFNLSIYNEKDCDSVKKYILEQYAKDTDKIEILPSGDPIVSIVKITSDEHITYVTLGAGAYTIDNRLRRDMQNYEFVIVASKGITQEQENFILENTPCLLSFRAKSGHASFELDTFSWEKSENDFPIEYSGFMILRSADPLTLGKRHINFMFLLPLYEAEIYNLWNRVENDFLFYREPHKIIQEHKGLFFKTLTDTCGEKELLYVDVSRAMSPYATYSAKEAVFGYKNSIISWAVTLRNSRSLATKLWQDVRSKLLIKVKMPNVSKNFKYEVTEEGINIKGYIGTDYDVIIPEEIRGKPVVKIDWHAFSPINLAVYSRASEVRRMLRKVTINAPLKELFWHGFDGCEFIEEVVVGRDVCLSRPLKEVFGTDCLYYVTKDSWAENECKRDGLNYKFFK